MLCLVAVFHWPNTWCEHRTRSRSAGPEEAPSATLAALWDKESEKQWKTMAPAQRCTIQTHLPRSRRSSELLLRLRFGLYTCTSLHHSPPCRTGAKASQSCQILSWRTASLPFSSTLFSEWDYKRKRGQSPHQPNNTTVSRFKTQGLYILSLRYTLELQELSFQHHLLCLNTRGQQHAGHPHWGGFGYWEENNGHNYLKVVG